MDSTGTAQLREFGFQLYRRVNRLKKRMIELPTPGHFWKCTCRRCVAHRLLSDEVNSLIALTTMFPLKVKPRYAVSEQVGTTKWILLRHTGREWVEVCERASRELILDALDREREMDRVIAERIG